MSSGGRRTRDHRITRLRPRVVVVSLLIIGVIAADSAPLMATDDDQRERHAASGYRFADIVPSPGPATPWPDVLDALRRAAGSREVKQSQTGSYVALHAARCIANSPRLANPHKIAADHPCGSGVDQAAARTGAANSAISMRAEPHTPRRILEDLAARPFHSMALMDPAVTVIDVATAYRPDSPVASRRFVAATWLSPLRLTVEHPPTSVLMWPAPGWGVAGRFTTAEEWPSPLWPCGVEESGPPVWIAVPALERAPQIDSLRLVAGDEVVDRFCVYSSSGFSGGDSEGVGVARRAMDRLSAVVIVPLAPLDDGQYVLRGRLEGQPFERAITVDSSR